MSRIVLEVERGKVATSSDMLINMGGTLEGVLINALLVVGGSVRVGTRHVETLAGIRWALTPT
jgi:hypothetical protein